MADINVCFKDHSYAQVVADPGIISELRDYFSFDAEGAKFNPKVKYGIWDGKIRMMGVDGTLPLGLAAMVKTFANNMDYSCELDIKLNPTPQLTRKDFDEWINNLKIYSGNTEIKPHWYQLDSVFHAINKRKAILNLPTSAGKSLIQALISRWYLENYEGKVLIIVPTISLVTQMKDDFIDYRLFPSAAFNLVGGGNKHQNNNALITVATWQTAIKQSPEWFEQFGMMMNDECFHGDTLIKTPNGEIKIKDLKTGDAIYSMNEETGEVVIDEVVKLHTNLTNSLSEKMYELEMDNGVLIKVTGNHKFMTKNRGWVRADELTEEDDIIEF